MHPSPPSPGRFAVSRARRRSRTYLVNRLRLIDAGLLLVVIAIAIATSAGSILVAAGVSSPTSSDSVAEMAAGQPTPDLPELGASPLPQPTVRPGASPSPSPSATPTPKPTPTPVETSKPPDQLKGYVWPVRNARITSRFGPRSNGFVLINGERAHDGLDLATWCNDKIRAAHDGVVLYAGRKFDPYLGYSESLDGFYARIGDLTNLPVVVVIDDGNGYRSVYAHLSTSGLKVSAGDVVKAGQVIGLEGANGRSTGCHLHFALIRMDGPWQDVAPNFHGFYPPAVRERVDPLLVLPLGDASAPPRLRKRHGPPAGVEPGRPLDEGSSLD